MQNKPNQKAEVRHICVVETECKVRLFFVRLCLLECGNEPAIR